MDGFQCFINKRLLDHMLSLDRGIVEDGFDDDYYIISVPKILLEDLFFLYGATLFDDGFEFFLTLL